MEKREDKRDDERKSIERARGCGRVCAPHKPISH